MVGVLSIPLQAETRLLFVNQVSIDPFCFFQAPPKPSCSKAIIVCYAAN
jgi:hypothetical protein